MRGYDPRHDPAFADRLLALLVERKGEPVDVYAALGIRSCGESAWRCVWVHVKRFRRHGYVIESRVGAHGIYSYVGMERQSGCACAVRRRSR